MTTAIRRSLRMKLTLIYAIGVGVLSLGIFLEVPGRIYRNALAEAARKAEDIAAITAYSVSSALQFQDSVAVEEVMQASRRGGDVVYLVVTDPGGVPTNSYGIDRARAAHYAATEEAKLLKHANVYRVHEAVRDAAGVRYGDVYLGISLDRMAKEVAGARAWIGFLSILLLLGGIAAVYTISAWLTRPLVALAGTAERIAAGDLSARVVTRTRDELSVVSTSFNTMVEKLTNAHEQLREANERLAGRVESRTAELRHEERERSKAETAMAESDLRFRTIFESSALGVALFDTSGQLIESNAALLRMMGSTDSLAPGHSLIDLIDSSDRERVRACFVQVASGKDASVQFEAELSMPDTAVYAHVVLSAVSYPDGLRYVIGMVEDISEQRRLEALYRQSQKLEAVGQLAGGVAHDFNNILTTINGTCDLLLTDVDADSPQYRDILQIRDAGERAAGLTRQLLAFSRKQVLQPVSIDPAAVVAGMAELLSRLVGEDTTVTVKSPRRISCIRADKSQLEQVILNLVVNAKDAMPHGGRLKIECAPCTLTTASAELYGVPSGDYVEMTVTDSGAGMDDVTLGRIFEPFFTTKKVGQGTGLGLSTVYGIMQQSGGGIRVETTLGVGSVFRVVFPAEATEAIQPPAPPHPEPVRGSGTIMIVEDENTVRNLFVRVMRRAGYEVLEASHGLEALIVSEEYADTIDLVISDVIMPRMNGPEAVKRLIVRRPNLKVLYVSGYTQDVILEKGLGDKAAHYLQKPVTPAELTTAVRDLLYPDPLDDAESFEPALAGD